MTGETRRVSMRMKHRLTWGLLLAAALTLGACRAPNQGGQESDEPTSAPLTESSPAAPTMDDDPSPTESPGGIDEY